jgi:hypothetical protein
MKADFDSGSNLWGQIFDRDSFVMNKYLTLNTFYTSMKVATINVTLL